MKKLILCMVLILLFLSGPVSSQNNPISGPPATYYSADPSFAGDLWATITGRAFVWGSNIYGSNLSTIFSTLGTVNPYHITLGSGSFVGGGVTSTSNIAIEVKNGAKITVANATTFTVNGPFEAPISQVFVCTGTGKVVFGSMSAAEVHPEWFDTTGGTNMTAAIQLALDSTARKIVFQPGVTYVIPTSVSNSRTTPLELIGHGSIIDGTTSIDPILISLSGTKGNSAALGGAATAGDNSITCGLSVSAGDLLYITSTDLWIAGTDYNKGEFAVVKGSAAGVISLDNPLYDGYVAATTTVWKMNAPDITVSGLDIRRNSYHTGLRISAGRNVRVERVRTSGARLTGIYVDRCYDAVVDDYTARDAYHATPTNDSYGLVVGCSQNVTVQNSDIGCGRHGFASGGGADDLFSDAIPNRNLRIVNSTIDMDQNMSGGGLNFHGNAEYVYLTNVQSLGGSLISAGNVYINGGHYSTKIGGNAALDLYPQRSCDFLLVNADVESSIGHGISLSPAGDNLTVDVVNINGRVKTSAALKYGIYMLPWTNGNFTINNLSIPASVEAGTGDAVFLGANGTGKLTFGNVFITGRLKSAGVTMEANVNSVGNLIFNGAVVTSTAGNKCLDIFGFDKVHLYNGMVTGDVATALYNRFYTMNELRIAGTTFKGFTQKRGIYVHTDVALALLKDVAFDTCTGVVDNNATTKTDIPIVVTLPSNDATITVGETATYNTDNTDQFNVLALAQGTDFGAPGGTPTDGQKLLFRITDNGTARTLTWNAVFDEGDDLALPTTTVLGKTMYCSFVYNSVTSKWQFIGQIGGF